MRGLFRAMAIHAASETSDKSPDFTAAVAYGLRSLGQHPKTTNEGTILDEYYRDVTQKLEERAVASACAAGVILVEGSALSLKRAALR